MKTEMAKKVVVRLMLVTLAVPLFSGANRIGATQEDLEAIIGTGCEFQPDSVDPASFPPYVPHRYRDALPRYKTFLEESCWSTNRLIKGLICAVTNNIHAAERGDWKKQNTVNGAICTLHRINHPAVTNFFRQVMDSDSPLSLKRDAVCPLLYYTNLEPEVMEYMRTVCVRTNVYENLEACVIYDMLESLSTMPDEMKPAATNRVAKYMYFSIWHTVRSVSWQDKELSKFIPSYSNSVQRLSAMKHVEATTQNPRLREWAKKEVDELSAIPTNQLNNISWIAEDVTGGK